MKHGRSPNSRHHRHNQLHRIENRDLSEKKRRSPRSPSRFQDLPSDILLRIAAPFDAPTLRSVGSVCRSWFLALRPLREGMLLFLWGKRFRHGGINRHAKASSGRGGEFAVRRDPKKALDAFLKAAGKGLAMAMVDAGLMYWEMGRREDGVDMYKMASELGHPAGMCNLALAYLEGEKPELEKAVVLFRRSAKLGYAKAQHNLALSLQYGRGVKRDMQEAAIWYTKAAQGGYTRAMYNVFLCYSLGEELPQNTPEAQIWLERAASCGHKRAQMELGTRLMLSGDNVKAFVYLELAARAGETDAAFLRDVVFRSLSETSKDRAIISVNQWRPRRLCFR